MKQQLRPHAILAMAILALLATACGTPEQDSCGEGEKVVIDDATYCVFKQAVVIENGFSCPISGQSVTVREPIGVCGQQQTVPPQQLDEIDEVYAEREPEVYEGYCSEMRNCESGLTCKQRVCVDPASMNADADEDGVADAQDNCPNTSNADQADTDDDGTGDACEQTSTTCTTEADCPADNVCTDGTCLPGQPPVPTCSVDADCAADELCVSGVCEADNTQGDTDGDGIIDEQDNCPNAPNPGQVDTDGDGTGDACEPEPRQCTEDADCAAGEICANNTCISR